MTRLAVPLLIAAALAAAAPAHANPPVPQPNSPCTADLDGASTMPPGRNLALTCRAPRWQPATAPGDPSDRWVSFGPALALHGEGLRNPNLESGSWTATPLDPATTCAATQQTVISAGVLSRPEIAEGAPGQRLSLQVLPSLFDITMTGHCLWERTGP